MVSRRAIDLLVKMKILFSGYKWATLFCVGSFLFPGMASFASPTSLSQSFDFGEASKFPRDWWKSVPQKEAASWEILPQAARPGQVILSKRNELGLLSNFAATPFVFEGVHYASLEGFWQMMKFPEGPNDPRRVNGTIWPYSREQVGKMVGFQAKRAGDLASKNMKALGIEWVTYNGKKMNYGEALRNSHYQLIRKATVAKIQQNPKVYAVLEKTRGLILRPDHDQSATAPPAWKYFEIYMELRDQNAY